ncbi:serine O-acetyltransferase [Actinomyces succiniciruminis]|uniref:Bacterial transferase hexapeptide (Six repeats) n=1 Tax=Actinomyces succiniciruminis TaxID=1522002 RepID=A0A1L7RC14_9ACTO|nr:serine acetyltransferase [Actinomyces succiniciruminis]CED91441.1 Bacterial transferase hexapeptide (six repeats) [Actinomyces succiniciruminis]
MNPVHASYSAARRCARHGLRPAAHLIRGGMRPVFACDLSCSIRIGKGSVLPRNALGAFIHPAAEIGENCKAGQNVTIGRRKGINVLPRLGDRVTVGCGSLILGPVTVSDDAVIGARAVVIHDVPSGATAVGVPARILEGRRGDS